MNNKEFTPDDRVRLQATEAAESPLPHITCQVAHEYATRFLNQALPQGETFLLAIHLQSPTIEPDRPHTSDCPCHNTALKGQVLQSIRSTGS